jgi:hypothetical protein
VNPNGIPEHSPGLPAEGYPGSNVTMNGSTLKGLERRLCNPFRVGDACGTLTQGSASNAQPWAEFCNAVGVEGTAHSTTCDLPLPCPAMSIPKTQWPHEVAAAIWPLWVFAFAILGWVLWFARDRKGNSGWRYLKAVAVSFVLSPTLFLVGWFAFSAPATLVLLSHLLSLKHAPYKHEALNLCLAGLSFLLTTGGTCAYLARKKDA